MNTTQSTVVNEVSVPTVVAEAEESCVSSTLSEVSALVEQQAKSFKELQRHLKKLEKEVIREHKRHSRISRPKRTVVQRPVTVKKSMQKFLKKLDVEPHADGGWTRQVMMKAVSTYIKNKDLQLAENRKQWKADHTLVKLFGLDTSKLYTFMNINGLITRVKVEEKK
jgi:hypothetical protein